MKKIIYISSLILFLLTLTGLTRVWAQTLTPTTTRGARLTEAPTLAAERQATELQTIISRANDMIAIRLASLNTLLTRIQNDSRLSSDEKTTLEGQVNTMISNLQTLKAKIDADTDVTTARADTKTIVTSYHVYVTFEPQIRLLIIVDNLQTTTATVQALVGKLTTLSATLKSEGKDTTKIDAAIADMNTQLTAISAILSKDQTTLNAIALTNNTYQTTFTQIRQDMATVRADFAKVRSDVASIRGDIHSLVGESTLRLNAKTTPTQILTPTAAPTP